MTVSSTTNKIQHSADGVQVEFTFNFLIFDEDHMLVYIDDVLQSSGYTVDGIDEPTGGTVTFDTAPANGTTVTLLREVPISQLISYQEYDPFPAKTHEEGLDLGVMVDQQLQEQLNRAIMAPVDYDPDVDFTLPDYDAGKAIMWHETLKELTNSDDNFNDIVSNAQAAVVLAEAWAEAAAGSAPPGSTHGSAKAWAETAEDVEVIAGQYSAKHWAAKAEDFALTSWEEDSNNLRPKVSGYGLGDATHLIGDIYQGNADIHYFGDSQESFILYNGAQFRFWSSGELSFRTTAANGMIFGINNADKWWINSSGHLEPDSPNLCNIGSTTNPVQHIYQGDNNYHYFGSDQDAYIYHTGANLKIVETTGLISLENATGGWIIDISANLIPDTPNVRNIGSASVRIQHLYQGLNCYHYFGNAQEASIYYDATYLVLGVGAYGWQINSDGDLLPIWSGLIDIGSQTNLLGNIYQGDNSTHYFGTGLDALIYFDALDFIIGTTVAGATAKLIISLNLTNLWAFQPDGDIIPYGNYNIGSATNELGHIYQADNAYHYLGSDQDLYLYHDGSHAYISCDTGRLHFATNTLVSMQFFTNSALRWTIEALGHLVPGGANVYNIGNSSNEIHDIYQGDNGRHYLGSDQDIEIWCDGNDVSIINNTGSVIIGGNNASGNVYFRTDSTYRWYVSLGGNLIPFTTNVSNIGATSFRVQHIYQGDDCYHYFGNSQDAFIRYDGTQLDLTSTNSGGHLQLRAVNVAANIYILTSNTQRWYFNPSGDFLPYTTNTVDIGSSDRRVKSIYSVNDLDYTSDIRKKNIIGPCSFGLDFVSKLNPIEFTRNDDSYKRQGLGAQHVIEVLQDLGIDVDDFSGVSYDAKNDEYGMSNMPYIAALINAVKELKSEVEYLKAA